MKYEQFYDNISKQSSVRKIDRKLAILLTSSYLFLDFNMGMMDRTNLDEGMSPHKPKEEVSLD